MANDYRLINWKILGAVISGPIYAAILLLIPFGMLTAISVVMDPGFVIYEFLPEELLFIPWLVLSIIISSGNIRISNIFNNVSAKNKIITISDTYKSDHFQSKDNGILQNLAQDIYLKLKKSSLKDIKSLQIKERDYGLDVVIEDHDSQIIAIALSSSFVEPSLSKKMNLIIELLISFEPPFFPWKRIKYNANIALKLKIESIIVNLLNDLNYTYVIDSG